MIVWVLFFFRADVSSSYVRVYNIRDGQNIEFYGYISIQCSMLDIQVRVFMNVIGAKIEKIIIVEKQEGKR